MIDGLPGLLPEPSRAVARLPDDWDEEYHEASKLPPPARPVPTPDGEPEPVAAARLLRLLASTETPFEVVVLAHRVPGVARGAYDYASDGAEPGRHVRPRPTPDPARFHTEIQLAPMPLPAATIVLIATFAGFRDRHGLRGYRCALVAAGRAAAAFEAAGAGDGLRVQPRDTWVDDAADRLLGLDGVDRSCLYLLGVYAAG